MKKMTINPLIGFFAISLFLISCGNEESSTESGTAASKGSASTRSDTVIVSAPIPQTDTNNFLPFAKRDDLKKYASRFYNEQPPCLEAESEDCGSAVCDLSGDYCSDRQCLEKIKCCHRIEEWVFDSLTARKSQGHASFRSGQIDTVMRGARCGKDKIEFFIEGGSYTIRKVTNITWGGSNHVSYYSVGLLQGILNRPINSIAIYRSIPIEFNKNIVPFSVSYRDGTVEFYDVSNDHP